MSETPHTSYEVNANGPKARPIHEKAPVMGMSEHVQKLDDPLARINAEAKKGHVIIAENPEEQAAVQDMARDANALAEMADAKTVMDMPAERLPHPKEIPMAPGPKEMNPALMLSPEETAAMLAEGQRQEAMRMAVSAEDLVAAADVNRREVPKPEPKKGWLSKLLGK